MKQKGKRVAVVMGGWSGEREVSLTSAKGVIKALGKRGYDVTPIDLTRDIPSFLQQLDPKPDVIFMNAMHGRWGEDGCLQGLIEMLGIPYTNSGLLASSLAMDKPTALRLFREAGLPCPDGVVAHREQVLSQDLIPIPFVVKPLAEGSSLGVHIIHEPSHLSRIQETSHFGDYVLVEPYIPGREIQVAVLGDKAIGAIEIRPKNGFYDYEAKYSDGKADHIMPAPLPEASYKKALELAEKAHKCLGCEGVSRVDMRYDDTKGEPGEFYILEVNTQPGMTPLSLVPEIAAHAGISFGELVEWMVENPRCPS